MSSTLYLITRTDEEDVDWDEYKGFVVVAETEQAARQLCQDQEKRKDWLGADVKAEILSVDLWNNEPRIVLSDFRAG